jgi:hypothetical protein
VKERQRERKEEDLLQCTIVRCISPLSRRAIFFSSLSFSLDAVHRERERREKAAQTDVKKDSVCGKKD